MQRVTNLVTMKTKKAKEPVRIRYKELANGNQSIYLDIYQNGVRKYEFLKLYLIPEKTPFDKKQNEATRRAANAIKAQRIIDLANGKAEIKDLGKGGKLLVAELFELYAEHRAKLSQKDGHSLSRSNNIKVVIGHIQDYRPNAKVKEIDKDYCKGFSDYIQDINVYGGKHISKGTAHAYFSIFKAGLNFGVKRGLVASNPVMMLEADERPKAHEAIRDFLTIEELKLMMCSPAKDKIKKPFLFSCFTGLRFGDVMQLTWSNIVTENGVTKLRIKAQKTQKDTNITIPNAADVLPERGNAKDEDFVFQKISNHWMNVYLKEWVEAARIKGKKVTFHTARHTYATLLLTLGNDLYTVSKLLGHSEIRTTQIYAEIIDKKKEEAVNKLEGIL